MVKQLSVFLQNKSGKIAAITDALARTGIDIRALSIADTTDFGILRMLVSNIDEAKRADPREIELRILKNRSAAIPQPIPYRYYPAYSCFEEL